MRRRLAVLCVFVAVVAAATVALLHRGSDQPRTLVPGAGNSETTEDPLAWDPDRRAELERRAAAAARGEGPPEPTHGPWTGTVPGRS